MVYRIPQEHNNYVKNEYSQELMVDYGIEHFQL